jgi:peptidoglycan/LPS O-acetylase OafA/YrhL
LAILMVFVNHYGMFFANPKMVETLWPGVDLFFALSGFLITGILYDSKTNPRYFRDFYLRRSLRIFPLYYGFFLAVALLTPVLRLHYDRRLWTHLFYVANLFTAHSAVHNPTVIHLGPFRGHEATLRLGALWSLCVEEQFYLTWPLVIRVLPSRRAMMWFAGVGVAAVMSLRIFLFLHDPARALQTRYLYFVTYTRCDTLLLGSWLALWLRGVRLDRSEIRRIAYPMLAVCALVIGGGYVLFGGRWQVPLESNPMVSTYGYTLVGLMATSVLLLALDESSVIHRVLRNRRLAALGIVSYGLYFFHDMPWETFRSWDTKVFAPRHLSVVLVGLIFALIYTVSWLSFRYFESPFLKLKSRLAPGHRSVPSGREDVSPLALLEE